MLATNRRFPAHLFSKFIIWTIGFFLFATATLHVTKAATTEAFHFQKGDIVAIYGNGLADRMQHAPWVETLLQNHLQGMDVRFRNMSFSGDTVDRKPRSKGFTDDEAYLQHVGPSVIFIMYGYNESFEGEQGKSQYTQQLVELVEKYRQLRKQKGCDVRFVLFSPIAYEQTDSPNLPDGTQLNTNLAIYTEATRQAATEAKATFVDLYGPTSQRFAEGKKQLTHNGIHLNDAGYRELADIISTSLLNKPTLPQSNLETTYDAVTKKNWTWHNRYHATDGNDVWGSRSTLTFVDGQSNADVLRNELVMLDVMTANRDGVIWAAAKGQATTIDDSNVPPPVKVISNVGGGSKSSSADKEGSITYLSPEESVAQISVPEGFELNVFASEEMFEDFANPVQLQVDGKGRLWAACWNTYPKWEPLKKMNDALVILEDTDHDGVADARKIFAHVHNPLGFEFWGGGVVVTSGPDLIFLKDTDGDDVADVRYPLLQGLGTSDTHHAANNLIYGPDGGIYWQSGIFLINNHETPWKQNLAIGESGMYRFDPRTFAITPHAANKPNPHGTSFDYWGYCYANDGTGGRSYQVRREGNGFKMHKLLEKEFRPVAANEILSSDHFPEDMQQDFLICNTIGFLGLRQYDLDRGEELSAQVTEDPKKNIGYAEVTKDGQLIIVNHPALKNKKITSFKLSVPGNQQMNLCEIEVISEAEALVHGTRHVTKNVKLSQSSEYNKGMFPATLLADGNKQTFAHTSIQMNPWMKGEFDEPVEISELRIWNRKGFEDRFNNGKIEFFDNDALIATVSVEIGTHNGTTGHERSFGEVWGTPVQDIVNSNDRNFRPTDAIVGEDGALYVADWQNVIIGHMQHNIRDPNRDHSHGRIIRVTVKNRPLQKPVAISGEPIEKLLENLKHPVNGVRHRTRVELSGRDSDTVIEATQKWMGSFDPNNETEAHHLVEALWLHQQHNIKNQSLLDTLLNSTVQHAVEAAKTVEHFWTKVNVEVSSGFAAPAESDFVKFEIPKHLDRKDRKTYKIGAEIYQREAHCSTCHLAHGKGNGIIYPSLVNSPWVNGSEERLIKATLHGMWGPMEVHGKKYDPARGVPPMTAFRNLLNDEELAAVLTFVRNTWGNEAATVSPETVKQIRSATSDQTTFWKPADLLADHPLEPELVAAARSAQQVFSNIALEKTLLATPADELARTAMKQGNTKRGKNLFYKSAAACATCHHPPKGGIRLGPDLQELKTKRTPEQLVESLLYPSKLIDKEYVQVTVITNDGKQQTGIRTSENDKEILLRNLAQPKPVSIKKDDIEEVFESPISLMPENLVRQLKNRQEFNDLMRYVLEVRKR